MSSSTASTSGFIPHPPMFLKEVRPLDIALLLGVGFGWEFLCRLFLLALKMKPRSLLKKEATLEALQRETNHMRKMGPSKFVETAKLERQVLAKEKEMEQIKASRKTREEKTQKILLRYGNMTLTFLVFVVYYGVAMFTLEPMEPVSVASIGGADSSPVTLRTMLFPVSYIGFGMRVARWGLDDASNSMGALVCFWSGQMFATKIMDAVDALFL